MPLTLTCPLVFFDLETTGTDFQNDRIIEISLVKLFPDGNEEVNTFRINPSIPIPAEATAIHYSSDHVPMFATFTFTPPMQSITVLVPNGGELWVPGGTYQIQWSSENVDSLKMFLTTDNGFTWELFAENVNANDSSFSYTLPLITPDQCKVKIVDESNDLIFDESDSVFTIDILPSVEDYYGDGLPTEYNLSQNFPNPFNPSTTIYYSIPQLSFVTLKVYDVLGNEVAVLFNAEKQSGYYEAEFNSINLVSGVYFYKLQALNFVEIKKMILLK